MRTITEFPVSTLKTAMKTKQDLLTAGKTAEELPAAMGEALKLEGDKLTNVLNALEVVGTKTHDLKRVVVFALLENEKAPAGVLQKGDHYFAIEYFPPLPGSQPKGRGPREDGGRGGKRGGGRGGDKRGGRGGERGGRGGERGGNDRGRGPRPGGAPGEVQAGAEGGRPPRGPRPEGGGRGPRPDNRGPRPVIAGAPAGEGGSPRPAGGRPPRGPRPPRQPHVQAPVDPNAPKKIIAPRPGSLTAATSAESTPADSSSAPAASSETSSS
jgi:hypothetical protein